MTQYRGSLNGTSEEVIRLGSKKSGLMTECNAKNIGVTCLARYNKKTQKDEISVFLNSGKVAKNGIENIGIFCLDEKGSFSQIIR